MVSKAWTGDDTAADERPAISQKAEAARVRLPLVQQYLDEQHQLSAVERFSTFHDHQHDEHAHAHAEYYEELIPNRRPGAAQQYAFRVDLDRCTGCKACVTACHALNGLDEDETWRAVGLLQGGTVEEPFQQTVTTACHHCLEPACMKGCPVLAYEKDPKTGIVRHLDDQCIGCQYCTLTCPYEVPQYNPKRGIVRKCDMCTDRLAAGEAPACVQACPNEAIAIQIVEKSAMRERAESDVFLPTAPSPGLTLPTTEYVTTRALPNNALAADFYRVRPGSQHAPLAVMLVLTQFAVGAFSVGWFLSRTLPSGAGAHERYQALVALVSGLLALGASLFHLGRPLFAYRALLGLKTSWLSREILAFGAFASLATTYALFDWQRPLLSAMHLSAFDDELAARLVDGLGVAVILSGTLGILCSALLYRATGRALWNGPSIVIRFVLTALVLGTAVSLVMLLAAPAWASDVSAFVAVRHLCKALLASASIKLLYELGLFTHLRALRHTDLKRSALLMTTELRNWTLARFTGGALGGVLMPLLLLGTIASPGSHDGAVGLALAGALGILIGELAERALFFSASTAPRMPGVGP